jgi:hypothetical protein
VYAVGLPCFALVVDRSASTRLRRAAVRVWFWVCLGFLTFEGGFCLFQVANAAYPGPRPVTLKEVLNPRSWQWPVWCLFPETKGTIFERIFRENTTVAVSPPNVYGRWRVCRIMGQMSQPIGFRKIVYLDDRGDMTAQAVSQHVRYIVWDTGVPIPPALESIATRVERTAGFVVLTLP